MKRVFVDTSFYIALLNSRDISHAKAVEFAKEFHGESVTTEYVLTELGNWLARSGDRPLFVDLVRRLQSDPRSTILASASDLFNRGLKLYANRLDKDWSLTDCISFVIMQQEGLSDALTADHHFQQAGFSILLK